MEQLLVSLGESLGSSLNGEGEELGDLGEGEGDLPREVVQVMQVILQITNYFL